MNIEECAELPPIFKNEQPYANKYEFAYVDLPKWSEYKEDSIIELRKKFINKTININIVYNHGDITYITIKDVEKKIIWSRN